MARKSVLFNFSRKIDQIKPETDIWEIIYCKLSFQEFSSELSSSNNVPIFISYESKYNIIGIEMSIQSPYF